MSSGTGSQTRSVVPRWRPSFTFKDAPEANPLRERQVANDFDTWFETANADWLELRTAGALADAFSAALAENRIEHALRLARDVQAKGDEVPRTLQRLAEMVLEPKPAAGNVIEVQQRWKEADVLGRTVSFLRRKSLIQPLNAFVWNDLAYHYLMLGENDKAARSMHVAVSVSNHHRLIARSAARCFLHLNRPDTALAILVKGAGFSQDPWLLSAHVAISQGVEKSSKYLKQASAVLEPRKGRLESSELGMALATEALFDGRAKIAKKLAKDAVVEPTENSLAQGVWLSRELNTEMLVKDMDRAQRAYEAHAWSAYYAGNWEKTLENSLKWLNDQPFSSRPAILASFVAGTFLRNFKLGEDVAKFSLRTNPENWMLKNNLVVSLAEQDKLEEAANEFAGMPAPGEDEDEYPTWLATQGLIKFRQGQISDGRALYTRSILLSRNKKDRTSELIGALYQSLEEARIGETGLAADLLLSVRKGFNMRDLRSRDESRALEALNEQIRTLEEGRKSQMIAKQS